MPKSTLSDQIFREQHDGLTWTYVIRADGARSSICGANAKNGHVCHQPVIVGRNRCRLHGGKTLRGIETTNFKTGRYSKYLPAALMEKYHTALADPDLLALSDEIAVLQAQAARLMEQLEKNGDTYQLWLELQNNQDKLEEARTIPDPLKMGIEMAYWMNRQAELIRTGVSQSARGRELWDVFERMRRLSESEQKRRIALNNYMTAEQVMVFLAAVTDVIKSSIHDKETLRTISGQLARLITASPGE